MFKIMDGMEQVNRQMVADIEAASPRCHMRPMGFSDGEDYNYWECSVCGHTKEI